MHSSSPDTLHTYQLKIGVTLHAMLAIKMQSHQSQAIGIALNMELRTRQDLCKQPTNIKISFSNTNNNNI